MADYLAARGFIVVAFDHLGVGGSSSVDDIFLVTPRLASAVNDHAHRTVMQGLVSGTLVPGLPLCQTSYPIGVGHSMGGMLLGVQQARHATFAARRDPRPRGRPPHRPDRRGAVLSHGREITRRDGGHVGPRPIHRHQRPREHSTTTRVLPSRRTARTRPHRLYGPTDGTPFSCGLTSMLPGSTDQEKAAITAPVFLGFGEDDLTQDFMGCVRSTRQPMTSPCLFFPVRPTATTSLRCVRGCGTAWRTGPGGMAVLSDKRCPRQLVEYRTPGGNSGRVRFVSLTSALANDHGHAAYEQLRSAASFVGFEMLEAMRLPVR